MKYKDNDNDKGNAKDNGKDNDKDHDKDKDKDNDKGNEKYKDNDKGTLFQLHPGVTACHQQDLDQGESTFAVCVLSTHQLTQQCCSVEDTKTGYSTASSF